MFSSIVVLTAVVTVTIIYGANEYLEKPGKYRFAFVVSTTPSRLNL